MAPRTLDALMEHHERLDALFEAHQEALVGLDLARAKERLEVYRKALLAHMEHEEREVLPRYTRCPPVRGGGIDFFEGEHARLRKLLGDVCDIVLPLDPASPDVKREVVRAFDRAALFKGLLEHHDLREGQLLYPRLAEVITEDEWRTIVEGAPVPPR